MAAVGRAHTQCHMHARTHSPSRANRPAVLRSACAAADTHCYAHCCCAAYTTTANAAAAEWTAEEKEAAKKSRSPLKNSVSTLEGKKIPFGLGLEQKQQQQEEADAAAGAAAAGAGGEEKAAAGEEVGAGAGPSVV